MTSVASTDPPNAATRQVGTPGAARAPKSSTLLRWPPGTAAFAFRTWVALALALYAAFLFQLKGASSAAVCVLILAQPSQGMVLSKSLYRLLGTLIGAAAAILMTSAFPQDRTMLLAVFTVFMAAQTAVGSILRDFRSYAAVLAGYTVAIVSITTIDAPDTAFDTAINRVAAIVCGIIAMALANFLLAYQESSLSLTRKLRAATRDLVDMAHAALDRRTPPTSQQCVAMSVRLMPLRGEISFTMPERADGRARAKGARSALLGLFEAISAIRAVGHGLQELGPPSTLVQQVIDVLRKALRLQNPEKCLPELEALALPAIREGSLNITEAFVYDRAHYLIQVFGDVRDGQRSLRTGLMPRRIVKLPVHQDYFGVFLNAARVLIAVGFTSVLAIWSGWNETTNLVLFAAVYVSLGGIQPDPRVMGNTALFGLPAVVVIGAIYSFFILPNIQGFPLFVIVLAPLVVMACWFVTVGLPGAGLIVGVMSIVLISPANTQTLDPTAFVSTASVLTASGVLIWATMLLVLPVDPAQRQLRLALSIGRVLRRSLADEDKREQPRASKFYDCLDQFNTWQRGKPPNLARRKTMKRLADLGNLAYALRRAWRGLDRSQPYVDPKLDALARRVLPSLIPDATMDVARAYLSSARGQDGEVALQMVRAAAALYGTSVLTTTEKRLLRRIELLARPV